MKRFSVLVVLLSFNVVPGIGQNARNTTEAIHFIKLANTFRALEKPEEAIDLLKRALPTVQPKNRYWTAVTQELLGLAYNEQGNNLAAIQHLQQARSGYQGLRYVSSVWAVNELVQEISGQNLYAGVQFSASGAKAAVFQTRYVKGFYEKNIKTRFDMPIGADKPAEQVQSALKACIDSVRQYNVPDERIFIVLGNDVANKADLYTQLTTVLPPRVQRIDSSLTPVRAAELFTVGAIPRKVWPTTSALEISSGGTMVGYFDANKSFHVGNVAYGFQTLVNRIDGAHPLPMKAYRREAPRVIKTIADTALAYPFYIRDRGLQLRKTIGVGGDITWALLAYLYPEKANLTAVAVTMEDIERFETMALTNYRALTHPKLTGITDPVVRHKAQKEAGTVRALLDEKQLIAGAVWLRNLLGRYSTQVNPKRIVFIRNSDIGWVTGKFLETINNQETWQSMPRISRNR